MNIFERAGIKTRHTGITIDRMERIKREGSKPYIWTVPVTAASAQSVIYVNTEFPDSKKYAPLDSIEIVNNEAANNITVTINGGDTYLVPASTIRKIQGDGIALHHIGVTNNGAVNTTLGNIICTLQKTPLTIDKWVRGR